MAKITFIDQAGTKTQLEASSGTLMELAVQNNIQGIDGDCGGVCSCATCHVYVQDEYISKVGVASEIEKDMLELDDNAKESSRLSCQIDITEAIDGIILKVAN